MMESEQLVFLANDAIAQRLAVAWANSQAEDGSTGAQLFENWAQSAGVSVTEARRAGHALHANQICFEADGVRVTHPKALSYIRGTMQADAVKKGILPKPAPKHKPTAEPRAASKDGS